MAATGQGSAGGATDPHGWFRRRVQGLGDDRLRAGRDPVELLGSLVGPGEQAFAVDAGSHQVVVFAAEGGWWAAVLPTRGRGARTPYGWEHWSAYVRRRHLETLPMSGPADSATTLAHDVLAGARGDVDEHLLAAALAAVPAEDRAATEFLLALNGHPVSERTRTLPVTAAGPGRAPERREPGA